MGLNDDVISLCIYSNVFTAQKSSARCPDRTFCQIRVLAASSCAIRDLVFTASGYSLTKFQVHPKTVPR